ncbi:MAG: hypothetical protein WC447_01345 [Candidatus Paceibacterota bacterium]|jgi:hypothetical protein
MLNFFFGLLYGASFLFSLGSLVCLFWGKDKLFEKKFWNPFFMDLQIFFSLFLFLIVAFCFKLTLESETTTKFVIMFVSMMLFFLGGSFLASLILRLNLKQRIKMQQYLIKLVPAEFNNLSMIEMKLMFKKYIRGY